MSAKFYLREQRSKVELQLNHYHRIQNRYNSMALLKFGGGAILIVLFCAASLVLQVLHFSAATVILESLARLSLSHGRVNLIVS